MQRTFIAGAFWEYHRSFEDIVAILGFDKYSHMLINREIYIRVLINFWGRFYEVTLQISNVFS